MFNLSTTTNINYCNGKRRVSTILFEVKCHPEDTALLKHILCKATANDNMLPRNDNIHFVAYGLPHYTSSELYRSQTIKHNSFLHNLAVIPIVNIDSDAMYQELYPTLLAKETIRGIEEIYLTHSSEKWLIIATKNLKHQAQ